MYEGLFSFGFSFVWKLFYPALECFFNIYSIPTRNVYKLFEWSQVSDITLAANRASTRKLLSITTFWCFLIEKYFNKTFQFDKELKLRNNFVYQRKGENDINHSDLQNHTLHRTKSWTGKIGYALYFQNIFPFLCISLKYVF